MLKVRAHTCYLGKTGYASHAREFFRELSNHVELRVRNYTWDPNPDYINNIDIRILDKITSFNFTSLREKIVLNLYSSFYTPSIMVFGTWN